MGVRLETGLVRDGGERRERTSAQWSRFTPVRMPTPGAGAESRS